jgi:hypothetical protein
VLIKRTVRHARRGAFAAALPDQPHSGPDSGLDRRSFLRRSGLVAGNLTTLGALPLTNLRKADAGPLDQRSKYPKGADPIVLGESVNTLTTYGFDPVTGMQEPKATLCQIRAA